MTGILAIDPGATSGYCIIPPDTMKPYDYGQLTLRNKGSAARMREIVSVAAHIGATVLVIEGPYKIHLPGKKKKSSKLCPTCNQVIGDEEKEKIGWKTYYGMGVARGRWEQLAREFGLSILEVNPRTWQAHTVGTGKRDQQIAKYKDRAKHLTRSEKAIPADAAAAICIADWAMIKRRNGSL